MKLHSPLLAAVCAVSALGGGRVCALPANLAPQGVASGSSQDYGSVFADGIDGVRDGNFYSAAGSVWHTVIPDATAFYEVDLGAVFTLDRVMVWPRTDALQGTLRNVRLDVYDAAGTVVWTGDFLPGNATNQPWGTSALRGVTGRRVRLSKRDATPNFLTFAEFEVWGGTEEAAVNLARLPGAVVTASPPNASTSPALAVNGDLHGDYATTSPRPVYLSAASAVGQYWQVDLGAMKEIDAVVIYNRTDAATTTSVRLSLLDETGTEVHGAVLNLSRDVLVAQGRQYDVTHDVPGTVLARTVKISTLAANALALAEVEVFGPVADTTAPHVTRRDPEPGALVSELTRVEVDFSEAVTGLDATDLLVNGVPATSLTSTDGTRATFAFAQPADGSVSFALAPGHGISDAAGNELGAEPWSVTLDTSLPAPRPVITEILAENQGGLRDEDGDSPDWIEIHNPGPTAVNLGGWFLSDDPTTPAKWAFPSPQVLAPGAYLVVFASSKNRATAGAELHTNFKLDPQGESVLLTKPDGATVVSALEAYPELRTNVSYGRGAEFASAALVPAGATARFRVPAGAVTDWMQPEFDDSAWTEVTTGVGFDVTAGGEPGGPLVGWWAFDDAAAPAQAVDSSGNGRTGTVVNATYTASGQGRSGQAGDRAMLFAGNGAVTIPAAASGAFDGMTANDALTVSLWVYGAADMPANNFAFYGAADTGFASRVIDAHLPWSDQTIYWDTAGCCDPGQTRISVLEPDSTKWRGQWNHYAFVKNGAMKEIWQNGTLLHASVNTSAMTAMRSFVIGAMNATGATGYRGRIDDFAVWDTALTGAQIGALATGASPLEVRRLTPLITTDTGAAMRNVNASAWLRVPFTVTGAAEVDLLTLRLRYDDGFVAWLNGTEVARRNAPPTAEWNSQATNARPAGAALGEETLDLSRFAGLLREGTNVLAIQGLNATPADGDFLLLPELWSGRTLADRHFTTPTPGAPNGTGYSGFVSDVKFAPQRGFHDAPVTVTLTCATPGAVIAYTTDGSTPTEANGTAGPSPLSVTVGTTTTLRATAFAGTLAPTNVDTHTYLFVDHVAAQQRPSTSPATWAGGAADFAMDPRVPAAASPHTLRTALLDLPTLSLTTDPDGLWSAARGIYANPQGRGFPWERVTSVEWMAPDGEEAHATGGLRIHGNISRDKGFTPKHGFSLRFRAEYGDSRFRHALFPGSPVDEFDELVLRAGSTDTWPCTEWGPTGLGLNGEPYQRWNRDWASYIRDQWVRDAHLDMGQEDFRGRYCHLYLNGSYWGVYNVTESPHASFMAAHLGGDEAEWDTVADFSELHEGTRTAWDELLQLADSGQLGSDAGLRRVQGLNADGTPNPAYPRLLEVDSLIDYMILHILIGADDWPDHNWWGARRSRAAEPEGFRFFAWDQEISNVNTVYGRSSWGVVYAEANASGTPTRVYSRLRASAEFRMLFADRVQRHLFGNGALSQQANVARWQRRVDELDAALVAESARWGDSQANHTNPGQPYTRENAWLPHLTWMSTNYWPQLPAVALQRFRAAALYPSLSAPVPSVAAGEVAPGAVISLQNGNAAGTSLVFTTDGSDPRLWGGAQNTAASTAATSAQVTVNEPVTVKARVRSGTTWSALMEATYFPDPDADDDGLPDAWETANGLSATDPADAAGDADGDGRTAAEEWAAGTDPRSAASVIDRELAFSEQNGAFLLRFPLAAGRTCVVERCDDLSAGSWRVRATFAAEPAARTVEWSEAPNAGRHFYRLVITPPPLVQ